MKLERVRPEESLGAGGVSQTVISTSTCANFAFAAMQNRRTPYTTGQLFLCPHRTKGRSRFAFR